MRIAVWQRNQIPSTLCPALDTLTPHHETLREAPANGIPLVFEHEPKLTGPVLCRDASRALIRYSTVAQALRGLGSLLSQVAPGQDTYVERMPFDSFGVMLDCSRNAVMKPDHIKSWMRQLALLGYNTLLLYTENTYALPDEPCFGYMRGRYTADELRDLDAYADTLGIELIGCIQTLGHLEHLLKWSPYRPIKDTSSVLLVDDDRTYALIDKMLSLFARTYRSRRIHIGMDETHDLGRGRYMDRHGYKRGYDLFNRHLKRVVELCNRHGLNPMIWSDMYFRMGNPSQSYYDPATVIPEDVQKAIPPETALVYWDYDHEDQTFYEDWIQRHRQLGHEPIMASGIRTWGGHFWYAHQKTAKTVPPCLRACRDTGVKEIFFTLWADDGAYCEYDSALAGLAYAAELVAQDNRAPDINTLTRRFRAVCGGDWQRVVIADTVQNDIVPASLFWDDPLLGIYWKNEALKGAHHWPHVLRTFNRVYRELKPERNRTEPMDFAHWSAITDYLRKLIQFRIALDTAYPARDLEALGKLTKQARRLARLLDACNHSFRRQWMRRNQPQGLETLQNRIGARKQRWIELAERLEELVTGTFTAIPELDERPDTPLTLYTRWRDVCSGGIE